MKPSRLILRAVRAGCFGVLVFLFINTASNMMQSCGSSNFVSWFGAKLHEKVIQYGDRKGQEAYRGPNGEDNWTMVAPHLKLKYYVGPGMLAGFILGAAAGAAMGLLEWRRAGRSAAASAASHAGGTPHPTHAQAAASSQAGGSAPAASGGADASPTARLDEAVAGGGGAPGSGLTIPAHWPLLLALIGILFHGYLLGLVAVAMADRIRAKAWFAWLKRAVGAAVVLFWGIGTELWWGAGWSTTYRGLADFLKMFFAGIGME